MRAKSQIAALHHDARCRKCSGTGRQGVDIGGIVVHPLGWTACGCVAPTHGTQADNAIERVWICGCGERISLRRRGQNARAAVARHRTMVREHLASHRGNPCAPPTPTPPARDDLSPYVRQGLVADAVMRLTREDLLAAAVAHPDSIHVVHDSVSIDLPAKDPK